ncbi:MAG TPA: VTT domain-containing protein [Steroidobacteraceae bacterium]|nr:VTT domain-containing protein [Steroidobacteraceae bacterium]
MTDAALPAQRYTVWRRAAVLVLLTLVLATLALSDALHAALVEVLAASDVIIKLHPVLGAAVFVAFTAVSAMLAFVSAAVLLPVAVFTWGEATSILLLWFGWTLGGACSYAVGRFLGREVVKWLTAEALLKRLEQRLGPSTPLGLVLVFQLALPSEIPGYVLGLVRYGFARYLLALATVELMYAAAMVELGASFLERRTGAIIAVGTAVVLLSVSAFSWLRRKIL